MIYNKRRLTYLGIALAVGVTLALAVVLIGGSGTPTNDLLRESAAAASTATDTATGDPLVVDPAKEEPLLDKFTSKDPFVPLATTNSTSGSSSTSSGTSSSTSSSTQTTLSAKIVINGTTYTVEKGDKVPSKSPVFEITSVSSSSLTFTLIDGQFENGESSMTVNVGESVKVVKDGGPTYTIKVVSVGDSGSSSISGHKISVLSITESNGTALVSLEIDGKTYADKEVGATFITSWGEIKILAIDVSAQTVTIMHGDQTLTLRAGQVLVK